VIAGLVCIGAGGVIVLVSLLFFGCRYGLPGIITMLAGVFLMPISALVRDLAYRRMARDRS
jgi:hypothetical protein